MDIKYEWKDEAGYETEYRVVHRAGGQTGARLIEERTRGGEWRIAAGPGIAVKILCLAERIESLESEIGTYANRCLAYDKRLKELEALSDGLLQAEPSAGEVAMLARSAALEAENRRIWNEVVAQAENDRATMKQRADALEAENRRLRERNDTQAQSIGTYLAREEDLRGYVVWHRHDGDLVKLLAISVAHEEQAPVVCAQATPYMPPWVDPSKAIDPNG